MRAACKLHARLSYKNLSRRRSICFIEQKFSCLGVSTANYIEKLRAAGIEIIGDGVYIEDDCSAERGVKIYAPSHIAAGTHLCRGATVMPYCHLSGAYVGENTVVYSSTIISSKVGKNCTVGPYAYLRGGAEVGDDCRIGDFVEIKCSTLGNGTKAAHLAYIGDAEVGERVNIGCGTVFANYDGVKKHKTVVGNGCFIGCNSNIIAPVSIKDGAYVAAGTTLTRDLAEGDFCIGRAREHTVPNGALGRYERR